MRCVVAAGGTKKKRKIGPNAETKCLYHDDVIDDCSDDSSDDDGGGGGKWNIMVGRYIDFLLGLPVLERNAGGVTSGVKQRSQQNYNRNV